MARLFTNYNREDYCRDAPTERATIEILPNIYIILANKPYPRHTNQNPLNNLYRIIDIVTRARYNAERHLRVHASLLQFTLTFNSIALIIIPLLDLARFNQDYSPNICRSYRSFLP